MFITFPYLYTSVITCVSALRPEGTAVKEAFTHSTVSLPLFHLHSQNDGQSFAIRDDFAL